MYYHDWAGAAVKRGGRVVTWGHQRGGGESLAVRAELDAGVIAVISEHRPGVREQLSRGDIVTVARARDAFAALSARGQVVVWGDRDHGGSFSTRVAPLLWEGAASVAGYLAGFAALKTDGSVVGWGFPSEGMKVAFGAVSVVANNSCFLALKTDGTVTSWGYQSEGADPRNVDRELVDAVTVIV